MAHPLWPAGFLLTAIENGLQLRGYHGSALLFLVVTAFCFCR